MIKKIIQILQLNHKWVRVMIFTSLVIILFIVIFPFQTKVKKANESKIMFSVDSTPLPPLPVKQNNASHIRTNSAEVSTIPRIVPNIHRPTTNRILVERPEYVRNDSTINNTSIQIQIIQESKSFGWKGTITWAIGAMNGLVLIILNIKNLLFKKNT